MIQLDLTWEELRKIYTDGSKLEGAVGIGVYSESIGISKSIKLPNRCSILQAEV